jgi:RNA polymerase sigma-70 factor, ECF subfamily
MTQPNLLDSPGVQEPEPEDSLVRRARDGDADAFGVLIERHQKAVAGMLISLLHDLDAAEDAAQQAFLKAYKNMKSFEGRSSFRTWVCRIAINEARTRMRWQKLRHWLSFDAPAGEDGGTWEERLREACPSENQEALERKLELERAMGELSPREREISALRLEGYALNEIAEILAVSEGTVKSTLFTATRKMRKSLS